MKKKTAPRRARRPKAAAKAFETPKSQLKPKAPEYQTERLSSSRLLRQAGPNSLAKAPVLE